MYIVSDIVYIKYVEKGYSAIPGIFAQDVTSWAEVKQIYRELKKPEVQKLFKTVIVDTVDVASMFCEKYVCSQNQVDTLGQLAYGQGWIAVKKEFESVFRGMTQLGYAVLFIAHEKETTFKREDGTEFNQIRPSVSNTYNSIIENMSDLYMYMHSIIDSQGNPKRVITLRSNDGTIACGSRFKYMTEQVPLNYDAVIKALNEAIDKESEMGNSQYVTDEKAIVADQDELNFDQLMADFNDLIKSIPKEEMPKYAPRITEIVEKTLGKGKKISNVVRGQEEQILVITEDLKELLNK